MLDFFQKTNKRAACLLGTWEYYFVTTLCLYLEKSQIEESLAGERLRVTQDHRLGSRLLESIIMKVKLQGLFLGLDLGPSERPCLVICTIIIDSCEQGVLFQLTSH